MIRSACTVVAQMDGRDRGSGITRGRFVRRGGSGIYVAILQVQIWRISRLLILLLFLVLTLWLLRLLYDPGAR